MAEDSGTKAFLRPTPTDQRAFPLIVAVVATILALATAVVRQWKRGRKLGYISRFDVISWSATIILISETGTIAAASVNGLGKHVETLNPQQLRKVEKNLFASIILGIVVIGFSQLSLVVLQFDIKRRSGLSDAVQKIALALVALKGLATLLAVGLQCSGPSQSWWYQPQECHGGWPYLFLSALNPVLECFLVISILPLLRRLAIKFTQRSNILTFFCLRLLVIPINIWYLVLYGQRRIRDDQTWAQIDVIVSWQVLLAASTIASDIVTISTEVQTLSTGMLVGTEAGVYEVKQGFKGSKASKQTTTSESFQLTSQKSAKSKDRSISRELGSTAYSEGGCDRDDSSVTRLTPSTPTNQQHITVTKSLEQTWEDGSGEDISDRRWNVA